MRTLGFIGERATLFVGLNVGAVERWNARQVELYLDPITAERSYSMVPMRGKWTGEDKRTVHENSLQIVFLRDMAESARTFEEAVLTIAERLCSCLKQEAIIAEFGDRVFTVTPDPYTSTTTLHEAA